ncbi:nuclear pore complex protein NUP1-like isoform X3 [Actinidia eriantha]|uniref:nuclear pore complex protein NUP1-like isoform X3 n=1 Tax=Actinidia eriantha TaxID=165200 RepID=UPI0025903DBA|nr:nuclear pore complex protein NUP1-like isoform X3 [Actinidia eriantha]
MSSGLYGGGEERGGGGKLRKPQARRPPSTPYYHPAVNQSQTASQRPDGGWLSKLVDPACRLNASSQVAPPESSHLSSPNHHLPPRQPPKITGRCI